LSNDQNENSPKVAKIKTKIGIHKRHLLFAHDCCVYFFDLVIAKD